MMKTFNQYRVTVYFEPGVDMDQVALVMKRWLGGMECYSLIGFYRNEWI